MLKISIRPDAQSTRLELEGRLAGPWVTELDHCWHTAAAASHGEIIVDLAGVTFVDLAGKALLTQMWQQGAQLHATGCLTRLIVEEITKAGRAGSSRSSRKDKRERS